MPNSKKRTQYLEDPVSAVEPMDVIKAAFAQRLREACAKKGWTQADLWRRTGIPSRAVINTYFSERSLPTQENLDKLSQALGIKPEKLLPHAVEKAAASAPAPFSLRAEPDGRYYWMQINRRMPAAQAFKIAQIMTEIDAIEASSGN